MLNSRVRVVNVIKKYFISLFPLLFSAQCLAVPLTGTVSINQVSDTAAKAKINAMNVARRQIISNVLSQYTENSSFSELIQNVSNDDLINLVSSVSVSNEQMSTNSYSANIVMNLDNLAVKKWLSENNVQNWVPLNESDERFTVVIVVPNGIQDWAELKRITRSANFEMETQSIIGNQIVVKMPLNYRTKFTASVRNNGWKYVDNNGTLQVWK